MLFLYHGLYVCTVSVFSVAKANYFLSIVYIFVQSEEEYCLIWKAKLLTIQTDKGKR